MTINNVSTIVIIKNIFKDILDAVKNFIENPFDDNSSNVFVYFILYGISVIIIALFSFSHEDWGWVQQANTDTINFIMSWIILGLITLLIDSFLFLIIYGLYSLYSVYKTHYIEKFGYPNNNMKITQNDNETTVLRKFYGWSD